MTESEQSRPQGSTGGVFERLESVALRVPFTLSTLALLALAGWLTNTAAGEQLGERAIARLGFSPADTGSFDVLSAMASALVTNGPLAFWLALAAVAILVGFTEWRFGSVRVAIAFWGSHLATLALSWVLLAPLHLLGDTTGSMLFLARDVGPSAGYMGCVGYLVSALPGKVRLVALASGVGALVTLLVVSLGGVASDPTGVSAALSHLLALPVGFILGLVTHRRGGLGSEGGRTPGRGTPSEDSRPN